MKPKHVVGLSGGKDSTAMALRLRELNPNREYEFIGNWTGNEPAPLFAHLRKLEGMLGGADQTGRLPYRLARAH